MNLKGNFLFNSSHSDYIVTDLSWFANLICLIEFEFSKIKQNDMSFGFKHLPLCKLADLKKILEKEVNVNKVKFKIIILSFFYQLFINSYFLFKLNNNFLKD